MPKKSRGGDRDRGDRFNADDRDRGDRFNADDRDYDDEGRGGMYMSLSDCACFGFLFVCFFFWFFSVLFLFSWSCCSSLLFSHLFTQALSGSDTSPRVILFVSIA